MKPTRASSTVTIEVLKSYIKIEFLHGKISFECDLNSCSKFLIHVSSTATIGKIMLDLQHRIFVSVSLECSGGSAEQRDPSHRNLSLLKSWSIYGILKLMQSPLFLKVPHTLFDDLLQEHPPQVSNFVHL